MKLWILALFALFLAACGSTQGTSGGQNSGDQAYWREREQQPRTEPAREQPAPEPAPAVEQPAKEPAKEPATQPATEPAKEPAKEPAAEPAKVEATGPKPAPVSDQQKNKAVDDFITAVKTRSRSIVQSAAYTDYVDAVARWEDKYQAARTHNGEDAAARDALWADAIKLWYEARYQQQVLQHLHNRMTDFEPVFMGDRNAVAALSLDELKSDDFRSAQAVSDLVAREAAVLNRFQNDALKHNLAASKVYTDEECKKVFEGARKKWQEAADGKIDAEVLRKYRAG